MRFAFATLILSSLFISHFALAQLDPSSGLLLNNDSKSSVRESGLDSGRYTVRKKPAQKTSVEKEDEPEQEQLPSKVAPAPAPEAKTIEVPPAVKQPEADANLQTPKLESSPIDQKKNNIVEISIAPVFIYNHSTSDISSRNYSTSGPAYMLNVGAWLNPNFGIQAGIMNSLASSVNDSYDHSRNANLNQQWISGGLRYRNYLSSQRNASSITLGIDYDDYQFQVDGDAKLRNRLETSGANLSLYAEVPASSKYSWDFGIDFMPKAKHQEITTASTIQSGSSPDADVIGISLGGKIYIDSANQMFWRLSQKIEKDQFNGDSTTDLATDRKQTNVSVTNSFTILQIGYTWGN